MSGPSGLRLIVASSPPSDEVRGVRVTKDDVLFGYRLRPAGPRARDRRVLSARLCEPADRDGGGDAHRGFIQAACGESDADDRPPVRVTG